MKKRLRRRTLALLALLTLISLLTVAPIVGQTTPPDTYTIWCNTCGRDTLGRFEEYYAATGEEHFPIYKCTVCSLYRTYVDFSENHFGGTATCTEKAVCSVCNHEYGEPNGHDWAFSANNNQTHVRTCQRDGCGTTETVPCVLDSANCVRGPKCIDCKAAYGDEIDLNNHDWGYWKCNGDMTHTRTCNRNSSHTETGDCSLWEADCTRPVRCSVCWGVYGDVIPGKHPPYLKHSNGNGTHTIKCLHNASTTHDTIEKCYGGGATCTQKGNCSACGGEYYADHVFTKWERNAENHWQRCDVCSTEANCGAHADDDHDHQCDTCGMEMSPHNFEAHDRAEYLASAATCVSKARYYLHCIYCGQMSSSTFEAGEVDPTNHELEHHDALAATCTEKGWNTYDTCTRCDYTTYAELPALNHDLVHHDAQTPTCTEKGWDAYNTCTRCDYTTYAELPALNHDLVHHDAQAPTCTEKGWDAYNTCTRCDYTAYVELPTLSHWYGQWMTEDGSATHVASCRRGCGHKAAVRCADLEYNLPMGDSGEEAYAFSLCPVCGKAGDGARLALVENVTAKAVTRWLPAGEAVLRLGTLKNGDLVLIVGFEYAGQLTQPIGQLQFALPAEVLEGFTLTVVNDNGTREPLDFTIGKDKAIFILDFTNAKMPAAAIHLTPKA